MSLPKHLDWWFAEITENYSGCLANHCSLLDSPLISTSARSVHLHAEQRLINMQTCEILYPDNSEALSVTNSCEQVNDLKIDHSIMPIVNCKGE